MYVASLRMVPTLRWMNSAMGSTSHTHAIHVTFVTSVACHMCEDAVGVLAEARLHLPFEIRVVQIDSS